MKELKELVNNSELNAKAELAMMGATIDITNSDLKYVLNYFNNVLFNGSKDHLKDIEMVVNKLAEKKITNLTVNTILDMKCVSIVIEDEENRYLTQPEFVIGYVYNMNIPEFSEYGYMQFEKVGSVIQRVA